MNRTRSRRIAAIVALGSLAMEAAALAVMVPNSRVYGIAALGFNGVAGVLLGLTYPTIGWLVSSRRPGNVMGWLFLAIGVSQAGTSFVSEYTVLAYGTNAGLPLADIASWLGTWTWVPGYVLLFAGIALFPGGTLPSPRWRAVPWLAATAIVLIVVPTAIGAWPYRGPQLANPAFDPAPLHDPVLDVAAMLSTVGQLLVVPLAIGALASLVVRFRRAAPLERLQIRWFALAAALEGALVLATNVVRLPSPFDMLAALLVIPLMPVAMTLAILRYRLYDIDRIISRTISWALVTAVIAAVFAGVVVALSAAFQGVTQGSTLAVAASTLVAFAIFQPLRRGVQSAVDRRFDRTRFDAVRMVADFTDDLRGSVSLSAVAVALEGAAEILRPAHVAIWIRTVPERSE